MDEFSKEVIERLVKLEILVEQQTSTLEKYIALQQKHTEIDAQRLDAVEDEIGFWKKLFVRSSAALTVVSIMVGLYLSLKK